MVTNWLMGYFGWLLSGCYAKELLSGFGWLLSDLSGS